MPFVGFSMFPAFKMWHQTISHRPRSVTPGVQLRSSPPCWPCGGCKRLRHQIGPVFRPTGAATDLTVWENNLTPSRVFKEASWPHEFRRKARRPINSACKAFSRRCKLQGDACHLLLRVNENFERETKMLAATRASSLKSLDARAGLEVGSSAPSCSH